MPAGNTPYTIVVELMATSRTSAVALFLGSPATSQSNGIYLADRTIANFWGSNDLTVTFTRRDFMNGQWHKLAFTHNGRVQTIHYVTPTRVETVGTRNANNHGLRMGTVCIGGYPARNMYWNGQLRNLMIFNTALTPSELQRTSSCLAATAFTHQRQALEQVDTSTRQPR